MSDTNTVIPEYKKDKSEAQKLHKTPVICV